MSLLSFHIVVDDELDAAKVLVPKRVAYLL
jgi:hypothetical protein